MKVESSGGALTSTYGTHAKDDAPDVKEPSPQTVTGTVPEAPAKDPEPTGEPVAAVPPVESVATLSLVAPPVELPTAAESNPAAVVIISDSSSDQSRGQHDVGAPGSPTAKTSEAESTAEPVTVKDVGSRAFAVQASAAPSDSPAPQATAFDLQTPPTPSPDPVSALLAVPGTVVGLFSNFIGALLMPFLAPGTAAPPQVPVLWAVLEWVRREITHTFFNRTPIANPTQASGQSLTGVVTGNLNAVDPNGDPLTVTVTQQGQHGTVIIGSDGAYTYVPNTAVPSTGITDSFTVTIGDSAGTHLGGVLGLVQSFFHGIAQCIGLAQPDTLVKSVAVTVAGTGVGIPPVVVTTVVGPIVTTGSPAVAIDPHVLVADLDSPTLSGATVKFQSGFMVGDTLAFTPQSGITGTYDAATGVFSLAGTATVAQYQAALQSVTFATTSTALVGVKLVSIAATDLQGLTGVPALVALTVLAVSLPPLVVTSGVGPVVTSGSPAVPLDPNVVVADLDSPDLSGATVKIGPGFAVGDTLAFAQQSGITGTYDAATGELKLVGTATVAQYQTALRSVTFATTSTAVLGVKTVSIVAIDTMQVPSPPGLVAVTVVNVSVPPVVVTTLAGPLVTAGHPPVALNPLIVVTDLDSPNLLGAIIKVGLGFAAGDTLAFTPQSGITGTYDAETGELRLTGSATVAQYQAALRSVTFDTTSAGLVGLRMISIVVTDTQNLASAPGAVALTVLGTSVNVPTVVVTTPAKLYTAGGAAVALDPLLTLVDVDSPLVSGATVTIGAGFGSLTDTLGFNDQSGITGSFDAATGVLSLNGVASLTDYQTALRSVTFASTALAGVKLVSVVVTADAVPSVAGVVAVTVASLPVAVNVPTVVVMAPAKLYTAGGAAVALDPSVTLIDVDSPLVSGATITVGIGFVSSTDTLGFSDQSGITGSFNAATGVLSLNGSASLADYQAALRSVTFASTGLGLKLVSIVVTADAVPSVAGVVAVTVASLPTAVNVPTVVVTAPAKLYTAGGAAVALDPLVTLVDVDSPDAIMAKLTIGGYDAATDVLAYSGPIGSTWDAVNGVLTLNGVASLADYQAALRSVTFSSTALAGVKLVSIVVTADAVPSVAGVVAVTVASLPVVVNVPTVVVTIPAKLYTAGGAAVALDPSVTLIDVDSPLVSGATVTIGAGFGSVTDTLAFTNQAGITGSFSAATGVLSLTGNASVAQYQAALRSVTFASTALAGVKLVSIVVTADAVPSVAGVVTVTVASLPVAVNVPTVVITSPATLYTAAGAAVVLDPSVTLIDVDSQDATAATVTIGGYDAATDTLAYSGLIGSTWDSVNGVLTLSGVASLTDYQTALRSVTFSSTALAGVKLVSIVVTADAVPSVAGVVAVTVASLPVAVNVPTVVVTAPAKLYTAGGAAVALDPSVTLIDVDSPLVSGATVTIGGYDAATDVLAYSGPVGSTWDSVNGVLTLNGVASLANYQTALRSITFSSTALAGVKLVSIVVTADAVPSVAGVVAVTVASLPVAVNVPTVVVTTPAKLYTAGGVAVALDPSVALVDVDSPLVSGATVTIGAGFSSVTDTLGFVNQSGIAGSFDAVTGVLSLTGNATVAQYQAALRSVTFASTGLGLKLVSIVVTADAVPSVAGVVAVTVAILPVAVNVPTVVVTAPAKLYTAGGAAVALDPLVSLIDVDSPLVSGATVTIGAGFSSAADTLGFANQSGITGSFNAVNGVLSLTGNASVAQYQAALRSVTFASTGLGLKTVSIVVIADAVPSVAGVVSVTVASLPVPVNVPPLVTTSGVRTYTAGTTTIPLDPAASIIDVDSTNLLGATITIGSGFAVGDTLSFATQSGITGSYSGGVLTLTGTATVAQYQSALRSVTFATAVNALAAIKVVSIVVTDASAAQSLAGNLAVTVLGAPINIPPLVVTSLLATVPYTAGGTAVKLDQLVTVTDVDSAFMTGAKVSITGGFAAGDVLAVTSGNGISGTYDSGTGVLTLVGVAPAAQYQQALRTVTFSTGASALAAIKTVSVVVTDYEGAQSISLPLTVTVISIPVNLAPIVVSSLANAVPFTAGNVAAILDPAVTILEDSPTLKGATVTIGVGRDVGDVLAFTSPLASAITGSYDTSTGVLSLSGVGTVAQYQAALRSVTFSASAVGLLPARTVSMTVTDELNLSSLSVPLTVTVLGNSAPLVTTSVVGNLLYKVNAAAKILDPLVTVVDDSSNLKGATVTIDPLTKGTNDILAFTAPAGSSITGNYVNGTLTLTGNGTVAQYQAALRSVTFSTSSLGLVARTVSFVVTDRQNVMSLSLPLIVVVSLL